jgi:hypothetical protein
MARNSAITHEDCVNAVELFDKRARRYERNVSKRGLVLTPELLQKCVIAADNDLYYAKGFRIRDMF